MILEIALYYFMVGTFLCLLCMLYEVLELSSTTSPTQEDFKKPKTLILVAITFIFLWAWAFPFYIMERIR